MISVYMHALVIFFIPH